MEMFIILNYQGHYFTYLNHIHIFHTNTYMKIENIFNLKV